MASTERHGRRTLDRTPSSDVNSTSTKTPMPPPSTQHTLQTSPVSGTRSHALASCSKSVPCSGSVVGAIPSVGCRMPFHFSKSTLQTLDRGPCARPTLNASHAPWNESGSTASVDGAMTTTSTSTTERHGSSAWCHTCSLATANVSRRACHDQRRPHHISSSGFTDNGWS